MESSFTTKFVLKSRSPSTVSDEEFKSFHNIDRLLFSRLIANLGRNPVESMQIMGFWLWMERDVVDDQTLVKRMLRLPFPLLGEIANETVMCLKCVESDTFPFPDAKPELYYLPAFIQRNVNFKYYFDNRIGALKGVMRMVTEVCSRAFRDILEQGNLLQPASFPMISVGISRTASPGGVQNLPRTVSPGGVQNLAPPSFMGTKSAEVSLFTSTEVGSSSKSGGCGSPLATHQNPYSLFRLPYYQMPQQQPPPVQPADVGESMNAPPPETYGTGGPTEMQDADLDEFTQVFRSSLSLMDDEGGMGPDERTIFLTFSKGYPISATEVMEFFTKKFGDFIEAIYMQEVQQDEQVLFARIVARSAGFVDAVVDGGRAKYNINGKHVWARKYVKKQASLLGDGGGIAIC